MGTRIVGSYNKGKELRALVDSPAAVAETFESQELYRRAGACMQKRNFEKAEGLLSEALKICPDNALYLSNYGLSVGMLGDLREGEKLCRKAIKLAPSLSILHVNLGRIFMEQDNRKDARNCFARAYELDNTSSAAALELSGMGVRRPPVIRFLRRDNPLNIWLGRVRHRMIGYRKLGWKKL